MNDSTDFVADDLLAQYGENAARLLRVNGRISGGAVCRTLSRTVRSVERRRQDLLSGFEGKPMPPAAEWLADNCYLVRRQADAAVEGLSRAGRLPRGGDSAVTVSLCRTLLRCSGGFLSKTRLGLFFSGCGMAYILRRSELDALISSLNAAVIFEIAELYLENDLTDEAAGIAKNLFTALRELSTESYAETVLEIDAVDKILMADPSGDYPLMSEKTRYFYRKRVSKIAARRGVSEVRAANKAMLRAKEQYGERRHVGFQLFPPPEGSAFAARSAAYIGAIIAATFAAAAVTAVYTDSVAVFFLTLLPFYELAKHLIDRLITAFCPPRHLPRMELETGVPAEGRTLCVICALLTSPDSGKKLAARLEQFRLANRDCGENLIFGILADLPDAKTAVMPLDTQILENSRAAVEALNEKYGGGFFLFTRPRRFLKSDKKFSAYERKRGAVTALCRLLCGQESELAVTAGVALALRGVKYLIALDEDTRLVPGSARQLIGAMLHPLNRAVFDEHRGRIVAGHGVIQPRMTTELSSVNASAFARIFAGQGGVDPYGGDVSEVYYDAFISGGFAGKGIIDCESFVRCLDGKIPENRVLSHDALEGAYLRGGFMGDVELCDTYPKDMLAYFRRMHRWVRGDWQNTPWLFLRGRGLALIDRFRLFDSVRRSLMPPALFLCFALVYFMPSRALYNAAIVAFISLAVHLFLAALESLFHRRSEKCRRLSYVPNAAQSAYLQLFVRLVVLPYEAYICLNAALTALWRMTVSRRRLLEWATASSVSSQKSGAARYASAMWFSCLLGLLAVIFAPGALGKASAIIWVMSPFFGVQLSLETAPNKQLSPAERDYLVGHSTKMWGYFSELCSAREHFLPPDNRQERPPAGVAHRTSPTNIGLCLLCCLAAADMKIASQTEAFGIAENILATLRRLEKWRGHLYNWYDTRTLKPLRPMSVSTVDSGNLAVCLIILREGLLEYGQVKLAAQCDDLLAPMCFTPLYNHEKRLLAVSYDIEKNCLSENCYDLFASEARSASFLAISRGDIPLRHWRALSRAQVQCGGYRGMVSWTGSMFEYMMPALFFTSQNGSLLRESERLCIAAQKKRTATQKQPWGISEGGFYALDRLLNYRYAPHGCGCLALHRGMDDETVISPYSSYLALKICPESAVKNLMALEKFGCGCRYGHWEAVDFTSGRAGTAKGEVVRCVMAHHLGMSLVAACNALCGEIMPKRLMRDPASCAYGCLLDERLPLCSAVIKRLDSPVKEKTVRAFPIYWERRDTHTDFFAPVCDLLSNGIYNVMLTDSGASRAMCGETCVYIPQKSVSDIRHGIDLYLLQADRCLPLLPSADMPKDASSAWQFSLSGAKFDTAQGGVRSQVICFVSENCCGEKRIVSVSSDDSSQSSAELLVTLEPLLAPYEDYVNHPAFCRLGMHSKQLGDALIIRRLPRGGRSAIFLCVACSDMAVFSARRDLVPGRGGLAQAARECLPSPLGWLRDPFICAKLPIKLCPDCSHAAEIAVAVGETEADAYFAAQQILTEKHGAAEFLAGQAAALGMTDRQLDLAMETLCAVEFPEPKIYNQHSLWRFGVSGDKPVVSCQVSEKNLGEAESAAKAHAFLSSAGVHYDLVFITDENGGYLRPVGSAIGKLTEKYGFSGILTVDESDDPAAVLAASAKQTVRGLDDKKLRVSSPAEADSPVQAHPVYEWDEDNTFSIYVNQSLPPRVWSNSLTNGRFGYLATDCGSGHMWYGNAREYQLTPWNGDPLAVSGETLELNGESLFAGPDGACCKVSYGYGFASWEKPINYDYVNLRAFVPADTDARVFIVTGDIEQPVNIRWFSELVLGAVGSPRTGVAISREGNLFRISREESPYPEHPLIICSNAEISGYTASRKFWLTGQYDNDLSGGEALGIEFKAQLPFVLVCGCDAPEKLSALCEPETALEALRAARSVWRAAIGKIKIKTPLPALDRLVNGWLPYQALACRMMGRCSVYQCGGAVGFRDQLQDAVNLMLLDTAFARTQILQSCSRQYFAGDVMHWWHETEKGVYGVRTRCSDDLLWLVWAVCEYIEATGDTAFLGENAPFLVSEPLGSDERDRYETALISAESASVLIHCKRAVDAVFARGTGSHGLLKIGTGDWNDGYDAVGASGQGESVWLTWFFCHTAERFASLCSAISDPDAARYSEAAKAFSKAANEAWDNDHFLRGYFDDGTALGAECQPCCKIDSTSQSFAALCSWADPEKTDLALAAAVTRLYDGENHLVKLLDPPFENSRPRPGYIESYGPGFRENGGQYTHGAIFLINALLQKGRPEEAVKLIEAILPEERCGRVYCAEPYVIAADVSSNPDCPGQAGWSWYTGSAGWLYRVVVQELLGIKLRGGEIVCEPRLPSSWTSCSVTIKLNSGATEKIDLAPNSPPIILPQNETGA